MSFCFSFFFVFFLFLFLFFSSFFINLSTCYDFPHFVSIVRKTIRNERPPLVSVEVLAALVRNASAMEREAEDAGSGRMQRLRAVEEKAGTRGLDQVLRQARDGPNTF